MGMVIRLGGGAGSVIDVLASCQMDVKAMRIRDYPLVIILDMNGTFMFGEDRFGPDQDFYATYLSLGGGKLALDEVNTAIWKCFAGLLRTSRDPKKYDQFPSVEEGISLFADTLPKLPKNEIECLVAVFAEHEVGQIPQVHAQYLIDLAQTHELRLISNIWSPKQRWLLEFERAGISGVFSQQVFSSDYRTIKPSRRLFDRVYGGRNDVSEDTILVGDSLHRDILPATNLGITTVWINKEAAAADPRPRSGIPDYAIPSLFGLDEEV